MKVNLKEEVLDLIGKPLKGENEGENVTIGNVLSAALINETIKVTPQGQIVESDMSSDEKFNRFKLAQSVVDAKEKGEIDINAEDIILVKKCVNAMYPPLIYGRVCVALGEK